MGIISKVKEKAKSLQKTIVLPEGKDERVVRAAAQLSAEGLVKPIVVGDAALIQETARTLGISLEGVKVLDLATFDRIDEYATKLAEIRAKKGLTFDDAKKLLLGDVNFFGAMMVKMNDADGMVSGSESPTANVLRAAIQVVGPQPGMKTVSSAMIMELEYNVDTYGEILVVGDCAVIPEPTAEQLADIAAGNADTARKVVGLDPKVALLSFSTKGSAKHESVDVVIEAGKILTERNVDFQFEAELQADAALVEKVGKMKAPNSTVAGHANVLIFPNLASGNIGYKLVQRLANAEAYGPLLTGLAMPINDLSRGCSAEDIVNVAAITACQAHKE